MTGGGRAKEEAVRHAAQRGEQPGAHERRNGAAGRGAAQHAARRVLGPPLRCAAPHKDARARACVSAMQRGERAARLGN